LRNDTNQPIDTFGVYTVGDGEWLSQKGSFPSVSVEMQWSEPFGDFLYDSAHTVNGSDNSSLWGLYHDPRCSNCRSVRCQNKGFQCLCGQLHKWKRWFDINTTSNSLCA
jgi:hypothetical protein